jgi:transposase-like protein
MVICPQCSSCETAKNGHIHNGKQRYKCHDCGRQFVEHPHYFFSTTPEMKTHLRSFILRTVSKAT